MKVKELIELLQGIEQQDAIIKFEYETECGHRWANIDFLDDFYYDETNTRCIVLEN